MTKRTLFILLAFSLILIYHGVNNNACDRAGTFDIERGKYMRLSASVAKASLDDDKNIILIDVRTLDEYNSGHIKGAILIPDYELESRAHKELADKNATIFIYCQSGIRSRNAANLLLDMGYMEVYDIGGIIDWP